LRKQEFKRLRAELPHETMDQLKQAYDLREQLTTLRKPG
jgi:hypothetical protein